MKDGGNIAAPNIVSPSMVAAAPAFRLGFEDRRRGNGWTDPAPDAAGMLVTRRAAQIAYEMGRQMAAATTIPEWPGPGPAAWALTECLVDGSILP